MLADYVHVWHIASQVNLSSRQLDDIRWKWTADGQYSAKTAYRILFQGMIRANYNLLIWSSRTTLSARCMHGWPFKGAAIQRTNWQRRTGLTRQFAPCASSTRRLPYTYLPNASSPGRCGSKSSNASTPKSRLRRPWSPPLKTGGTALSNPYPWLAGGRSIASLFAPGGASGRREMLEFLSTDRQRSMRFARSSMRNFGSGARPALSGQCGCHLTRDCALVY